MSKIIEDDILDGAEAVLRDQFYGRKPPSQPQGPMRDKPTHYKVVCISLYNDDIARLEDMVAELKRRGHTKASKSALIRFALDHVNLDDIPRGY